MARWIRQLGVAAIVAACSSSSAPESEQTPPQNNTPEAPPPEIVAALDVIAGSATTYVRQRVDIGARAAIPGGEYAFSWTLLAKPPKSTLGDAAIENGKTPGPSFTPDVSGTYSLRVEVTNAAGAKGTKDVTLTAIGAPVFFLLESRPNTKQFDRQMYVAETVPGDSQALETELTCVFTDTDPPAPDGGTTIGTSDAAGCTLHVAATAADAWEAPAGEASRVAFVLPGVEAQSEVRVNSLLVTATTASRCGVPGARHDIESIAERAVFVTQPRLSPNGNELAYLIRDGKDQTAVTTSLVTATFEGQEKKTLAVALGKTDVRPQWRDSRHVTWLAPTADSSFNLEEIWLDEIAEPKNRKVLCTGLPSSITQMAFLDDDSFIASQLVTDNGRAIVRYSLPPQGSPTSDSTRCVPDVTLVPPGGSTELVVDFALSPDRKRLAFLKGSEADRSLYLLTLDPPGGAPVQVIKNRSGYGPRWTAGGNLITLGLLADGIETKGDPSAIAVVSVEGVFLDTIQAQKNTGENRYGLGNGDTATNTVCVSAAKPALVKAPVPIDP